MRSHRRGRLRNLDLRHEQRRSKGSKAMLAYFKLSALPLVAHAFFRNLYIIMWLTAGNYRGPPPKALPSLCLFNGAAIISHIYARKWAHDSPVPG